MGRTLRISGIEEDVTEEDLRAGLTSLLKDPKARKGLVISLVPREPGNGQMATVTFEHGEPEEFLRCQPGKKVFDVEIEGVGDELVVDCDFNGMTLLYSAEDPEVDIVAVTGLAAHAFGSWKAPNRGKMWLRDFLPIDLQRSRVRILTFGYDFGLAGSTSTSSLHEFARKLLDAVRGVRSQDSARERPIIFIGHSLGGLVVKQALADARPPDSSEDDQAIFNSCAGLFFFGVPHKGLNNENMLSMVKGQKNEQLINDLKTDSPLLLSAYQNFLRGFKYDDCSITSFYETRDTPTAVFNEATRKWERTGPSIRMVSISSATWASPNEKIHAQVPIDADHSTIVKFTDRFDEHYTVVRDRIRNCVEKAPKIIQTRLDKLCSDSTDYDDRLPRDCIPRRLEYAPTRGREPISGMGKRTYNHSRHTEFKDSTLYGDLTFR